jgi:hypothetical protein
MATKATKATKGVSAVAETFAAPADVLGPVLDATQDKLAKAVEVPAGWELLPGGVEREIGVNRQWLYGYSGGRPWLVTPGGPRSGVAELRTLGECTTLAEQGTGDCGGTPSKARVVTSGPVLIKRK